MHKGIWVGIGILVLTIAIGWFFLAGVTDVAVSSVRITNVDDASGDTVKLSGIATLHNPSRVTIDVKGGTVKMVLDRNGAVLGDGTLGEASLAPQAMTELPITIDIPKRSVLPLAADLVLQKTVNTTVSGDAIVVLLGYQTQSPFSSKMDAKQYLKQALQR